MARIILPDPSRAFGPRTPPVQKFWRQKPQEPSDEERALRIIQAIGGATQAAAGLYGLGRQIYQDVKETPEEAVARMQREAVESRVKHMQGPIGPQELTALRQRMTEDPQDWDPSGGAEIAERAARARAQVPVAREEMTTRLTKGVAPTQAFALEEPGAPITREQITREQILQEAQAAGYPADHPVVLEWLAKVPEPAPAPTPKLTPARRNKLQEWMAAIEPEDRPHLVAKVRQIMGVDSSLDQALSAYGISRADYDKLNDAQKRVLHVEAQRMGAPRQRPGTPVTAGEFVERARGGVDFTISDLAESYGALIAAGKEAQARDLLQIARGAMDYASFITSEHDVPALVEARARNAIKSGAARAETKQVRPLGQTLRDLHRLRDRPEKGKKDKKKRDDGPTPPGGGNVFTIAGVSGFTEQEKGNDAFKRVALFHNSVREARRFQRKRQLTQESTRIKKEVGGLTGATAKRLVEGLGEQWHMGAKSVVEPEDTSREDKLEAANKLGIPVAKLGSLAARRSALARLHRKSISSLSTDKGIRAAMLLHGFMSKEDLKKSRNVREFKKSASSMRDLRRAIAAAKDAYRDAKNALDRLGYK